MKTPDVIIVGAGIAGLSCAGELSRSGVGTRLIEKSRGVGGRCATRRVDDQPVDHGVAFLHGADPEFQDAVESADPGNLIAGWPHRIRGEGHPCQPRSFEPSERRFAFADGVNTFPRRLAAGLEIEHETRVESIRAAGGAFELRTDRGDPVRSSTVVVAMPAPQALELLVGAGEEPDLVSARGLLSMIGSSTCLTVLAGYGAGAPVPEWDVWYPETSRILQTACHDSAKRRDPRRTVLVLQALPAWSRKQMERPPDEWSAAILEEAGRFFGEWAARPEWTQAHRWRYARADAGIEFVRPPLFTLEGGARLGLAGEAFTPGGGVQAAWRSGRELARRILQGDR